jgi:transcriptional regulator with XRE-family HTH domain
MDLYDYFFNLKKQTGIEMRDFAKMFNLSCSHMSCLIHAKRFPSFKLANEIEKITNGKVTMIELMKQRQNHTRIPLNATQSKKRKKREDSSWEGEQLELNLNT